MAKTERELRLVRRSLAQPDLLLNPEQTAVLASTESRLLVVGAPGTGKTTTLVASAIARIQSGLDPESILILTYGRERASDIRDRIALSAHTTTAEPIARTFHSLAFSIINQGDHADAFKYVLISGAEQDLAIRQLLQTDITRTGIDWHPDLLEALSTRGFAREIRDLILRATERGYSPDQLVDRGQQLGEPYWKGAAHFWHQYNQAMDMRALSVSGNPLRIDPSALITTAITHLHRNPKLLESYRRRFTTIYVDEFQESDASQRQLLELLSSDRVTLFADPDSAVGRFRGADPEGVQTFIEKFNYSILPLHLVERSSQKITELASEIGSVFRKSSLQVVRKISLDRLSRAHQPDRDIAVAKCKSPSDCANYIAHAFRSAHLRDGLPWSEMAVIVRSPGVQVAALQRAFAINGIPTSISTDALALADNPAIRPILLIAQIALGEIDLAPKNWAIIEEVLFSEFGGTDPLELRQIRLQLARLRTDDDQRTVTEMMIAILKSSSTDLALELPENQIQSLVRIRSLIQGARKSAKTTNSVTDVLWSIWSNATNYSGEKISSAWRTRAINGGNKGALADRDLDAVMELFEAARRFTERLPNSDPASFIDQLMGEQILGDTITARGQRDNVVSILTVHSAKGLEWEFVALAGMQEGSWPNLRQRGSLLGSERLVEADRSQVEAAAEIKAIAANALIEDERRLLHIAITRAKSGLIVTAFQEEESEPSAYFHEIAELVLGEDAGNELLLELPRSLTTQSLVAALRADLMKGEEPLITAGLLRTLADSGVSAANPDHWLGVTSISSSNPVVAEGEDIRTSPSNLQSFSECGVKWFLERSGGRDEDSTAQVLGSAVHYLAAQLASDASLSLDDLTQKLKSAWNLIDSTTGWQKDYEFASASEILTKFYKWHNEVARERTLKAAEATFEVKIGRVILSGSVDRLELTSDGKIFIADLKTGNSSVTGKEALTHKQLAGYQLAALEGGFVKDVDTSETAGAELVFLGGTSQSASVKTQYALEHETLKAEVLAMAEGMSGNTFIATINKRCRTCAVKSSCPIQSQGKSVIEP